MNSRPGRRTLGGFPGGPLPFVLLFLLSAVFTAPPIPGAEPGGRINREILQGYLEERGIPFQTMGDSIFAAAGFPGTRDGRTPPASAGETGILVLAVPLAYPGEPSLEEGPAEEGAGRDFPLRFAIPLSLIQETAENQEAAEPAPVLAAFLGGGESGGEAELEKILNSLEAAENSAPGGLTPVPRDRIRRSIFFLDIPMEKEGGTLVFRFKETPPLGQMLSIPRICGALNLPWSFENPVTAAPRFSEGRGAAAEPENPGGRILIYPRQGREAAGYSADGEGSIPEAALWGEFFRRYARTLNQTEQEDRNRERNYLAFRLPGIFFVISELPLALGFLTLALLFFCGILFLPDPGPSRRIGGIAAAAVLWAVMIALTAAAFHRLSLYPFYAPALIPAFAARSLRRPLPRYICVGAAILYLGAALFFL